MHLIVARNAHEALQKGCALVKVEGYQRGSRNGPVMVLPMPLTTLYTNPRERVIFWPTRDANPFLHFFEGLWMLAGRNDVAFLAQFAKQFAFYSDDGVTLHGAYGRRWRTHFGVNQLQVVADALRQNPDCRRQLLTMWDPQVDLGRASKDLPCNLQVLFQRGDTGELNMVVTNRSNDLIWGTYGSDSATFGMLQEFMAAMVGCPVGAYWQVSMNSHIYLDRHDTLLKELAALEPGVNPYEQMDSFPLVSIQVNRWMRELDTFFQSGLLGRYIDPFFNGVAIPMMAAHGAVRAKNYRLAIAEMVTQCQAPDLTRAVVEWCERRLAK